MGRMRYREIDPPPHLAAHVRCLWIFEAERAGPEPQRIVPDGRTELIVHFRAPYAEDGVAQPRAIFAGQLTRPLWLRSTGPAGVLGVRFHPAGARRFLGFALSEANDRRVDLDSIWPGRGTSLADAMSAAREDAQRVGVAAEFVAARIATGSEDDATVARCAQSLERECGKISIEALSAMAGVGRRQLERRFRDTVGVGPTLLASILRFRSVFDLIERDSARPWTEAAIAAGYYDQSHFAREFRRYAGVTATEFLATRPALASAIFDL